MTPEEQATRVRRVLSDRSDVTEGRMMGGHQFLVGGRIACSVRSDALTVRVLPERMEELLRKPAARPMRLGARTMKGFLRIDFEGVRSDVDLRYWVLLGVEGALARDADESRSHRKSRSGRRS